MPSIDDGGMILPFQIRSLASRMPIKKIHARQIYDSRGNPTVEVDLTTEKGIFRYVENQAYFQNFMCLLFRAAVPSGASTGIYEALEMRDKAETWHGKGVQKVLGLWIQDSLVLKIISLPSQAVHNVNNLIAPEIVAKCMDPVEQEKIDQLMVSYQLVNINLYWRPEIASKLDHQ